MDIRISIGLTDHIKYRRLKRQVGPSALEYLVRFWCQVAINHPTGELVGWSPGDVESAAGWTGVDGELFAAMVGHGWIDQLPNGLKPHDWEHWQTWVVGAPMRQESARKAIRARWDKENAPKKTPTKPVADTDRITESNTPRIRSVLRWVLRGVIPPSFPFLSLPFLTFQKNKNKNKKQKGKGGKKNEVTPVRLQIPPTLEQVAAYCLERKNGVDPERWMDHYAAKGWKVGTIRMVDWQAAVRTWEKEIRRNRRDKSGAKSASTLAREMAVKAKKEEIARGKLGGDSAGIKDCRLLPGLVDPFR